MKLGTCTLLRSSRGNNCAINTKNHVCYALKYVAVKFTFKGAIEYNMRPFSLLSCEDGTWLIPLNASQARVVAFI